MIDHVGDLLDARLPDDSPTPALMVDRVTEAVKGIADGVVVSYVDRDTLWEVYGFVLDRESLETLPDRIESAGALVEALRSSGRRLHAVVAVPGEPDVT